MAYIKNLDEPHCGNCKWFIQHYILRKKDQFTECDCGHCVYPRIKTRTGFSKACVYYEEKPKPKKYRCKRTYSF